MNIENLKRVKNDIEQNLKNDNEDYWQTLFADNSWILSQLFNTPFIILHDKAFVGGKGINNKSGKVTDFVYKNKVTKNKSLIEIKTPKKRLFLISEYRPDVPQISSELSGGVNQLLLHKQKINNEYAIIKTNSDENFIAVNIACILVIGNTKDLDKTQLNCFENYRNELRSIQIVCFNEVLEKINLMLCLLDNKIDEEDDNLPF